MSSRRSDVGTAAVGSEDLIEPTSHGPVARTWRRVTVHGIHLASCLLGDDIVGRSARVALLRRAGAELSAGVTMGGGTFISCPSRLVMGPESYMGRRCYLDLEAQLVIGRNVAVGHGVTFITTKHEMGPPELRCGAFSSEAITVGDGAWVGANVTVLPGVSIGSGAVIAAGAIVAADVAPNTLVGGMRARAIRALD